MIWKARENVIPLKLTKSYCVTFNILTRLNECGITDHLYLGTSQNAHKGVNGLSESLCFSFNYIKCEVENSPNITVFGKSIWRTGTSRSTVSRNDVLGTNGQIKSKSVSGARERALKTFLKNPSIELLMIRTGAYLICSSMI